jgi:hypothetical protein
MPNIDTTTTDSFLQHADSVDALINMAENLDDGAFVQFLDKTGEDDLNQLIDEATVHFAEKIYERVPEIVSMIESRQQMNLLRYLYFIAIDATSPNYLGNNQEVLANFSSIRWLREQKASCNINKSLIFAEKFINKYFLGTMTYGEASAKYLLARDMLRSLPNIHFPNKEFFRDLQEIFGFSRNEQDYNDQYFAMRASTFLYNYQMIGESISAIHKFKNSSPEDTVDFDIVLEYLPIMIDPVIRAKDEVLVSITDPRELGLYDQNFFNQANTNKNIQNQQDIISENTDAYTVDSQDKIDLDII